MIENQMMRSIQLKKQSAVQLLRHITTRHQLVNTLTGGALLTSKFARQLLGPFLVYCLPLTALWRMPCSLAAYIASHNRLERIATHKTGITNQSNLTAGARSWGAAMAQWWEHSLSTNVARVRFPVPVSYVGWVCCWFSSLLRYYYYYFLRFAVSARTLGLHPGMGGYTNLFSIHKKRDWRDSF